MKPLVEHQAACYALVSLSLNFTLSLSLCWFVRRVAQSVGQSAPLNCVYALLFDHSNGFTFAHFVSLKRYLILLEIIHERNSINKMLVSYETQTTGIAYWKLLLFGVFQFLSLCINNGIQFVPNSEITAKIENWESTQWQQLRVMCTKSHVHVHFRTLSELVSCICPYNIKTQNSGFYFLFHWTCMSSDSPNGDWKLWPYGKKIRCNYINIAIKVQPMPYCSFSKRCGRETEQYCMYTLKRKQYRHTE